MKNRATSIPKWLRWTHAGVMIGPLMLLTVILLGASFYFQQLGTTEWEKRIAQVETNSGDPRLLADQLEYAHDTLVTATMFLSGGWITLFYTLFQSAQYQQQLRDRRRE
ncbi:hypothetical protein HC891_17385 [Candidatus Gracilibacteria bacterium]|nr:hypothetical protein [Candidatus Gracilibacteria bacterium]